MFRHLTVPLVWPHIIVATVIRTIDSLKAFDLIFVISGGGPGTSSETINLYLYQTAFAFYNMGYAAAMTVVFFIIILLISLVLFSVRQREQWQ
jgi:multiple sugar transport system permease protein